VYGKQAETVLKTLTKGDEIFVQGRSELRTFETKDGDATVLKVYASTVQFLKVKAWEKNGSGQAPREGDGDTRTPRGNGARSGGNGGGNGRGNGSYGGRGNGSRSGSGRGF
jgi:single-strand DNA-binding protein